VESQPFQSLDQLIFYLIFSIISQKVLYHLGKIAQSPWAVKSFNFDVMLFEEFSVLGNEFAIKFLNKILFVRFGLGLLLRVRLIEFAACLKVHVWFGLFVNDLLFELDVR
jgi:hypothetical protein